LISQLKVEFIGSLEAGFVQSTEHFIKAFKLNGQVKEYVTLLEHMNVFKKIESNHYHVCKTVQSKISMLARVQKIVESNPISDDEFTKSFNDICDSNLIQSLWAMFRVYLSQCNQKKRTVWLYGRTNSGKSFLAT
jgi:hypothetical protein